MGATTQGTVNKDNEYEVCEAGAYPARCVHVIELGTQKNEYLGEVKFRKELMIVWELSELMQDGRPFTVNWRGTNTLNEKSKLYSLLTSWRGKPFTSEELQRFELKNILDKCCMINISKETAKSGKEYNKVISVMPLPKGMTCHERYNEIIDFGIEDANTELFDKIWPWVRKIIIEATEMQNKEDTSVPFFTSEAF